MQNLPKPYYQDDFVTLYHGNAVELLPRIDADVMVTDPPYGINFQSHMPGHLQFTKILNDNNLEMMKFALSYQMPRVIFGADNASKYVPAEAVWFVWDKRCNEKADNTIGSPHELGVAINCGTKQRHMYRIQHGGYINADGHGVRRQHPTQKPAKLMRAVISNYAKLGTIVDPFAGSGSTLRAAKDIGRKCIGIELDKQWLDVIAQRCAQEVLVIEE